MSWNSYTENTKCNRISEEENKMSWNSYTENTKYNRISEEENKMQTLNRNNEINIIGYQLPKGHILLGRTINGRWAVNTGSTIRLYTMLDIKSIYNVNLNASDLERLGWTA